MDLIMFKSFIIFFLCLTVFIGCKEEKRIIPPTIKEPQWIYQPNLTGKIGAVGSAKEHFKGKTAQRRLAISRALDELSQQSGVQVQSTIKRNEKRDGLYTNSSAEIYTVQNSANETIQAHIEAIWIHPKTKEIYIWLVAD